MRDTASRTRWVPSTPYARRRGGNYQPYVEHLKRRTRPDADQPHRLAYETFVRA